MPFVIIDDKSRERDAMDKFCWRCGSNIEKAVNFCINCGQKLSTENDKTKVKQQLHTDSCYTDRKKKTANKKKHFLRKLIALLICLIILSGSVTGFLVYFKVVEIPIITQLVEQFIEKTPEEAYATEIIDAFKNQDIAKINNIIFVKNSYKIDENIGVDFDNSSKTIFDSDGVFGTIFSRTKLMFVGVENGQFVYEIEAPNMKDVFGNTLDIQTQEDLIKYMCGYAKNAESIKFKVAVDFIEQGDEFIVDYRTEEFINAITGGLVDAYKDIYGQYIEDIISGEAMNYEKVN